ncbi:MAG TPA: PAS domain S-box protein [Rhizomicrobium sp.]|nr:PAS domain S-box protein [Rhizomicrobium sp.]
MSLEGEARFDVSLTDDARYRLLVDAIADYAINMLTPEGFVASWNGGAQRLMGYEVRDIIGHHFSKFYTPEDRKADLSAEALERAARKGGFDTEGWRVRKDGSLIWAHVAIDAVRSPSGVLLGFAQITQDLTERKRNQEDLRRSEEQFRLLVQGVTDYAIYMLDLNGYVTSWNSGAQRIKGYLPEEIIGQHFSLFYTEDDRQSGEPAKALAEALRDGRFEKEGWRVRKGGDRFMAHVIIDPIRNVDGMILGFAKITRDITERRITERALEKTREALFQSQKMDAIGQLTGGIAHDFNNLLMAVLGSLELVRKRLPEDPRITPLLDNAIMGGRRGTSLIQRMLSFARRQDLKSEAIDIPLLVRDMTDLLQRSLGASITIESRFPLQLARAHGDSNQLELAMLNLAVNARDAMAGVGTIVIAATEERCGPADELPMGRYICISVSDTGEGMDPETLSHATEPFFTTKGVGKGTGLGLAMVHGMAKQCGGRFMLISREGLGTTAQIWLPVATEGTKNVAEDVRRPLPMNTRLLKVLAVDDDSLVLMNTTAMLEDLGHSVVEASSAKAALESLRKQNDIDLIITDQVMPQMTGLQLVEMVKTDFPEMPIILATGYAELPPGIAARVVKLNKPFSEDDLAHAVDNAVQSGQPHPPRRVA